MISAESQESQRACDWLCDNLLREGALLALLLHMPCDANRPALIVHCDVQPAFGMLEYMKRGLCSLIAHT